MLLREQGGRLREGGLATARREGEARYRALADAMPQIVWTTGRDGKATYYNRRWYEYTGLEPGPPEGDEWVAALHPDDVAWTLNRRAETILTGEIFEIEYRFRAADGSYAWHLGRAVPLYNPDGEIDFWVGTATDIDARKRTEQAQDFLLRAGAELAGSLDYRRTLQAVARLAVPEIADWCAVDLLDEDGTLRSIALVHSDPVKTTFGRELQERYPARLDEDRGVAQILRSGEPILVREVTDDLLVRAAVDDLHLELLRELGLTSVMCVPLTTRDRVVGAITFCAAESGRRYEERDVLLAAELARRAGTAVENARLYREVEERAQAARVLAAIGDGVVLLDSSGTIRLWNSAAEAITGLPRADVVGRAARDVLPGLTESAPVSPSGNVATAETFPVEIGARELWLSVSGVDFEDGIVYAFRDRTEERVLEEMRQDLVATVSHELRTPLAAIYGSALTLRRGDIELDGLLQDKLLCVIAEESSRLADIVNDLLLASQLDAGKIDVRIQRCDAVRLVESVVDAARTHLPADVSVELEPTEAELAPVAADEGQLRQVLANVLDNAVKYSPDGGKIRVRLEPADGILRLAVADEGLGIPATERRRIFEKFYRLDPHMTRGIGGTGLGLYICRELVRRVDGRIWVEPNDVHGSVFYVEIPFAGTRAAARPAVKSAANRIG